jgi:hypothetical protein
MPTLFVKEYAIIDGKRKFIGLHDFVTPGCEWVADGYGWATRKWDGTPVAYINGRWYKRFDAKKGECTLAGAIEISSPKLGHHMYWVPVVDGIGADRWINEAIEDFMSEYDDHPQDGATFEAIGPKINGNREGFDYHTLMRHGNLVYRMPFRDLESIRDFLFVNEIEGIVFHNDIGQMCKVRRKDFGIRW